MLDVTSQTCIVTGANAGIGAAFSEALALRGATVIMACRSAERGRAAARVCCPCLYSIPPSMPPPSCMPGSPCMPHGTCMSPRAVRAVANTHDHLRYRAVSTSQRAFGMLK